MNVRRVEHCVRSYLCCKGNHGRLFIARNSGGLRGNFARITHNEGVMVEQNNEGPWDAECWTLVEKIRVSDDIDFVLSHVEHPDSPVRLKVAGWFDLGDAHWRSHNLDPSMSPLPSHEPMPNDIAAILIRDTDSRVATSAALRVNDLALLIDVALDPSANSDLSECAMKRTVTLDGLDEFLATPGDLRSLPVSLKRAQIRRRLGMGQVHSKALNLLKTFAVNEQDH